MPDQFSQEDKLALSLGYKKNIGNFSSLDFHASVSMTKRLNESDEDFETRVRGEVEKQLEWLVAREVAVREVIRPVVGDAEEWN